jgi:Protein of unknown function (DUF3732)
MQILSMLLYSKNGQIQRLDFKLGSVNIITGSRRTGKTAVQQIVEYCFGKGECDIPRGIIRSNVEWYGLLLQIGDKQVYVARRGPIGESDSGSDIFLEVGASIVPPPINVLRKTIDVDGLTATFGDLLGIRENLFTPPEGTTRNALEANFKHCWPYLFQRQDEVSSPMFLFHREKENSFMQQAIKDTLPYFLGVVKENRLIKQEELRRLRAEASRVRRRMQEDEWLRREALARGKSLVAAAQELGMSPNAQIPEDQETMVRLLKQISVWTPDAPIEAPGLALERLQDERSEMLARYAELNRTVGAMANFAGTQALFEDEISEQKLRLQSIGLLKKEDADMHCPLCDSAIAHSVPSTSEVASALEEVTMQLESVSKERARLDRLIAERAAELSLLRQQLRDKGNQIDEALAQNAFLLERRELDSRRSRALGRISLYLEGLDVKEENADLKELLSSFEERIEALMEELEDDQFDLELSSIANLVSEPLRNWSRTLDLEYAGLPYRFDPTRLTMVADTASGPITMNRMGGGTNALANHLLAFFCLHKWFADQKRPVPHFLMLDQISQAYYPADYTVDPNDDERLKVMQMYEWLFTRVEESKGALQLIVSDHADIDKPWFQQAVVARWRNGIGMVPSAWYAQD